MQAYKDGELIETKMDMLTVLNHQKKVLLTSGKADKVIISNLPVIGTEVEINGLVFIVTRTNKFGKVIMMLKRP